MKDTIYYKQVQLLVQVLPVIAKEKEFALKGGTAINLFVRDMPRLSVDIDLVYLPMDERPAALEKIRLALGRISTSITTAFVDAKVQNAHEQSDALRLIVERKGVRIKIELSPVIRGTVFTESAMRVSKNVEADFGYAEIAVVSLPDLYAGKICAALDRQHPRDLFDVKMLFQNEGFTEEFRKAWLVYLISHQRPMSELLQPNLKDISGVYENEFAKMTQVDISLKDLEQTREDLVRKIHEETTEAEKKFLLSFKSKTPDWSLLGLDNHSDIANLPAVRWKQYNLQRMPEKKHMEAFERLRKMLTL